MKKLLSLISIASIVCSVIVPTYAVTYPATTPTGEQTGGWFNTYFTNMFTGAGISQSSPNYAMGCAMGEVMRGFSSTGMVFCISPGLGSTSSATLSLSGALIGTPNYVAKYTPTGTGINNSQIYDNGTNVGIATTTPGAKLEINGQVKITGGTPSVGKVLTSDATGLATWSTAPSPCIVPGAATDNTCYGLSSLQQNTTGNSNTAYGYNVLFKNTTGYNNSGFGHTTLFENTTGLQNTAIGAHALSNNTTGYNNSALGVEALQNNITGGNNVAVGYQALISNITGSQNTALGYFAGFNLSAGTNNTAIGANTNFASATGSNQLNIANNIFGTNLSGSVGAPAGNIGIGTANPTAKLEIAGQIKITGGTPGIGKTLVSDATGLASWTDTVSGATATGIISGSGSANYLAKFGPGGVGIYASSLFDNGTNIGIGTVGPAAPLEIASNIDGIIRLRQPDAVDGWNYIEYFTNAGRRWYTGTDASGNYVIGRDGATGIASIQGAGLSVGGNTQILGTIQITGGSPGAGKVLSSDATGLASWVSLAAVSGAWSTLGNIGTVAGTNFLGTTDNVDLVFKTNNTENMRIQSSGNVGIGTATPGAKLEVNGQIKITGGTPGIGKTLVSDATGLASWTDTVSGATATGIISGSGSANYLAKFGSGGIGIYLSQLFDNGANVGIGTATPGAKLEINGQIKVTGGVPGVGKILISDATGLASWSNAPTLTNTWNIVGNSGTIAGTNFLGTLDSQALVFKTNNTEVMRANTGGNIGIGTANPTAKLEIAGQIKITGGTPGIGKTLVSDATGLASWTDTVSGATATGIISGSGSANYLAKFGTGGIGIYPSQLFDNGTNVGIGTSSPTSKFTIDSGVNNIAGLRFNRISATSTSYSGSATGLGVDGSGNLVPISNGDVIVYTAEGGHPKTTTPDPDTPNRLISYDFNTYFAIPTKQSFVVSDGAGAGYNAPYFKENGTSGLCSGGGSPYDCSVADPVTGLSASPNNSFTMTAKGTTYGYQLALGARGDAPLFARSGKFVGSQTGGLYLSDNVTPTPWQKVLTVPVNHSEYFYINIGYNSQLQAISGGGNIGVGTMNPQSRFEIWTGSSTSPLMHFRGTNNIALGQDALDTTSTGAINSASNNTAIGYSAGSNITTGSNNIFLGANTRAQSAASNNTLNIGNSIFGINLPTTFGGTGGNIGIGITNPGAKLTIDSGLTDTSGLRFSRLNNSAVLVSSGVTAIGVNALGDVVAISPISNIAVYEGKPRDDISVNPDPDIASLQIRYNFNNYFAIPGKQSFVVSKGDSAAYNGPYVKENGVSGICSGGGSPYDCANPDPVTGLSASPYNSFTMSAKSETVGYQIALSARGDAPLFARSGFFSGSTSTGGLYLANGVTPTPWQKVLSIPANHPEYFYVNSGYNSQLATQAGGGNVGIGTTFPSSRFEIWTGSSVAPLMHFRGAGNVALGLDALDVTATGSIASTNNTAIGYNAGTNITTGSNNIFLGADARAQSATSSNTLNIGNTLFANSLPSSFGGTAGNIGIGVPNPTQQLDISRSINIPATTSASVGVIYSNGTRLIHNYTRSQFPSSNLFIGLGAGNFTMGTGIVADPVYYGTENLGIGQNALSANTTGYSNTAIGLSALASNTSGTSNMALGYSTLATNTSGSNNTAIGRSALANSSTASNNTAIGFQSLQTNTTGNSNTANGYGSLQNNQGGGSNTAVGYQSMLANTTGGSNTALGYQALNQNAASSNNTSIGYQSLFNNTSGANNTVVGLFAGGSITTGSNNIAIGYNAQVGSSTGTNQLSIGNWIYGSGSNIGIGTSSPGAKLEIAGQIKITGGVPGNGKVLMSDAAGLASWQTPSGAAAIPWAIAGNAGTDPLANFVGTTDTIPLVFRTNNVERMRITATGGVGIGTNSPSYKLDIVGDLIATGWLRTRGNAGWYSETYGGGVWMSDATWVRIYNNKSFWTDSIIHSSSGITVGYAGLTPPVSGAIFSGNVGIGTNAPGAKLDLNGTIRISGGSPGNGKVLVSDATGLASWQALAGSSGALNTWSTVGNTGTVTTTNFVGNIDAVDLIFKTNNTERLRINANDGNLSINGMILGRGTASILGNTVLGVSALSSNISGSNNTAMGYQSLQAVTTGTQNTALGYGAGGITTGSNNIAIGYNAVVPTNTVSNQLSIGNWIYGVGGNIGIGMNNPGAKLEVAGQVKITGGTPGTGKVLTSDSVGLASWSTIPASLTEWSKTGNSIVGTDFLGSTNAQDLVFKTNNTERVRVLQNGNVSLNSLILGRGGNGTQVSTTALGVSALNSNTTGVSNTAMGNSALASVISGGFNTAMGHGALFATTGNNNTAIGYNAGTAITSGSNNIAIGYAAAVPTATASNQLSIGNWIYGVGGNIGIGTTTPGQKLTLSGGTIQIVDGNQGAGKYLKSDANGVASWQSPTTSTGAYIYRMAAGDTTSSSTLGTVTALTSTPLPVGPYQFELIGRFQSAATANGIGITLANISAASTDFIGTVSAQLTASSMFDASFTSAGTPVITTDVPVAATDYAIFMKGTFNVTSTGTVAIQYRSENNGTSVRLQPGTVLIIKSLDPALAGGGI